MSLKNVLFLLLIPLLPACNNEGMEDPTDACNSDFDQSALFTSLADQLIIPGYDQLQVELADLRTATNDFIATPNTTTLASLRNDWKEAYLAWQAVEAFEFGPAETVFLRNSLNNFPADTGSIQANIANNTFDADRPDTYDKGFPALDFLLYGVADDEAAIIDLFAGSPPHRNYLEAVLADMESRVETTYDGWTNGYRESFIQNTGSAAGTSLSLVINNLNEQYEITKRDRIGIPSGVLTLGFTNPDKTEAPFSGISLELAKVAVDATRRFYLGNTLTGEAGTGLDDLLNYVDAEKDGQPLDDLIRNQFQLATTALEAISGPLAEAVDSETEIVENAYAELSRQVINLKTDLPSLLCVSITYIDNPSDSD